MIRSLAPIRNSIWRKVYSGTEIRRSPLRQPRAIAWLGAAEIMRLGERTRALPLTLDTEKTHVRKTKEWLVATL